MFKCFSDKNISLNIDNTVRVYIEGGTEYMEYNNIESRIRESKYVHSVKNLFNNGYFYIAFDHECGDYIDGFITKCDFFHLYPSSTQEW